MIHLLILLLSACLLAANTPEHTADTIGPSFFSEDAIPNARYDLLADASQYSAFSECKPSGAAILRKEGEEPLCNDPKETSRTAIHDRLAEMVAAAFSANLPQ